MASGFRLTDALPFWLSLALLPLLWIGATLGGWWLVLVPVATWYLFAGLDAAIGLNLENQDPETLETIFSQGDLSIRELAARKGILGKIRTEFELFIRFCLDQPTRCK